MEKVIPLNDTMYLGFYFGMSQKQALENISRLKSDGYKLNINSLKDYLKGEYLLSFSKYKINAEMRMRFKNNTLYSLEILFPETAINRDITPTSILSDLSSYFGAINKKYTIIEDNTFDYYSLIEGNKKYKIYYKRPPPKEEENYHAYFIEFKKE